MAANLEAWKQAIIGKRSDREAVDDSKNTVLPVGGSCNYGVMLSIRALPWWNAISHRASSSCVASLRLSRGGLPTWMTFDVVRWSGRQANQGDVRTFFSDTPGRTEDPLTVTRRAGENAKHKMSASMTRAVAAETGHPPPILASVAYHDAAREP